MQKVKRGIPAGLAALVLIVLIVAGSPFHPERATSREQTARMILIPGGAYKPLFTSPNDTAAVKVEAYYLDAYPVTNAEFLAFVKANPSWQRSKIKRLFADEGYLRHWRSDLDFGPDSMANRPVVNVSWFAASAYAEWKGKRLPTTAEWELAASAGLKTPNGKDEPGFRDQLLEWYSSAGDSTLRPVGTRKPDYYGLYDLHGLVWEWVDDFNTALVTGDARNNTDQDQTLFCGAGAVGASDFEDYTAFLRFGFRSGLNANYSVPNLGFRCARDARPVENRS